MNLAAILDKLATAHPERIAFIEQRGSKAFSISYDKLRQEVQAGAHCFLQAGLKPGDTILFLHHINIQLYAALLACFHAGMTAMFVDIAAGHALIDHSLELHPIKGYFGSSRAQLLRLRSAALRRVPHYFCPRRIPFTKIWPGSNRAESLPCNLPLDAPALITFTSGSTGKPKAALRTHGFLASQQQALADALEMRPGERDLVTLPMFALANLAAGMTSIIADTDLTRPGFADEDAIMRQCLAHGVTRCAGSPAFFESLLNAGKLPAFDTIFTGGAPVFPHLPERLHRSHPATHVVTVYGSTEAEPISHCDWSACSDEDRHEMLRGNGLLVGKPNKLTQLAIISDHHGKPLGPFDAAAFSQLFLDVKMPGEIVVTGPHVLQGYLHGTGDSDTKIHVDSTIWHRTGDAGYLDETGRLWLLGRCAARLEQKPGERLPVYPFGLECHIMQFTQGKRVAVLDHNAKRTLVTTDNLEQKIIDHVCSHCGIEDIVQLEALPMDSRHNAKIDYPKLRHLLGN